MDRVNRREFLKLGAFSLAGAMSPRVGTLSRHLYLPFLPYCYAADEVPGNSTCSAAMLEQILSWQAQSTMIHSGGIAASSFANTVSLAPAAGGRTFISGIVSERIRQDGYIRQVKVGIYSMGDGSQQIKFKVFRPDGSNYGYISESESITVEAAGTQTYTLTQPMACQPGDILGVYIPDAANPVNVSAISMSDSNTVLYDTGDITGTDSFSRPCRTVRCASRG